MNVQGNLNNLRAIKMIEEKKTLSSLMDKVYEVEESLIEISEDEIKEMFGDLKTKVDSIYSYLTRLDEYEERLAKRIRDLTSHKKTISNRSKGLRKYVAHVMKEQDTYELFGHDHILKLQERESIKAKSIDITSDHYLDLNEDSDREIVKRSYSFDAAALKAAYKKDPEKYKDYVEVGSTIFPQFTLKKDM